MRANGPALSTVSNEQQIEELRIENTIVNEK